MYFCVRCVVNSNHFGTMEWCITTALGEPHRIIGYNITQVAKYDNYELGSFSEEAKHAWQDCPLGGVFA
ncbi:MAG: hypothetical protein J6C20_00820 [Paludibacteraceae bacterium]|nr:hypothetical protein [Paludibacteraceae bacterium]